MTDALHGNAEREKKVVDLTRTGMILGSLTLMPQLILTYLSLMLKSTARREATSHRVNSYLSGRKREILEKRMNSESQEHLHQVMKTFISLAHQNEPCGGVLNMDF